MNKSMQLQIEIAKRIAAGEKYSNIVTQMTGMTRRQRIAKFGVARERELKFAVTILAEGFSG